MDTPIKYIESAKLQETCGALLSTHALNAINEIMVKFARDYTDEFLKRFSSTTIDHEEFEKLIFGISLLPKPEEPYED